MTNHAATSYYHLPTKLYVREMPQQEDRKHQVLVFNITGEGTPVDINGASEHGTPWQQAAHGYLSLRS